MYRILLIFLTILICTVFMGCKNRSGEPVSPTENATFYSRIDWVNDHKNTTDFVEMALIKYHQAIESYVNAHPEAGLRSDWGIDYNGEISILTDLGVAGLPGLLREVNANSPFRVPVIFAIEEICRTDIGNPGHFSEDEITAWNSAFDGKLSGAKNIVADIVEAIKSDSSVGDEEINDQLCEVGIFALPYFYDEVVNNSNTSLLKYADKILPIKKLEEFNIGSTDQKDYGIIHEALVSCSYDIEIIRSLTVK
jgi:hypothetical protein